jgi:hypothetical protein
MTFLPRHRDETILLRDETISSFEANLLKPSPTSDVSDDAAGSETGDDRCSIWMVLLLPLAVPPP